MTNNYEDELKQLDDKFKKIQPINSVNPVPDGTYTLQINKASIEKSTSGTLQLKLSTNIAIGEFINQTILIYRSMKTEQNLSYLKKELMILDINISTLSELPAKLNLLTGTFIEVNIKTSLQYQNIYINKLVKEVSQSSDDIPF